jgi:hypothetical protein
MAGMLLLRFDDGLADPGGRRRCTRLDHLDETCLAEFLALLIERFGDAIAVQHDRRACGKVPRARFESCVRQYANRRAR